MKEKIEIFKDSRFGEIRTAVDENGNILFCLKDVCNALGISNSSNVMRYMDDPYLHSIEVGVETGIKADGTPAIQQVQMTFIGEPNLYRCIFQSRKKIAKDFQKWVFDEVLPSIRKNGGYLVATEEDDENTIVERALNLAQKAIQRLKEQNTQLTERNDYLSEIYKADSAYTVTQIAKDFGMSAIRLNKILADLGIQYKRNGQWYTYAEYNGLTKNDAHAYYNGEETKLSFTTKWLPRGVELIANKLKDLGYKPNCSLTIDF